MKVSLRQSVTLRQELRMNPRLYQAMDLLYMPLLDLQQHLKQELLVNPFLELIESEDEMQLGETGDEEKERAEAEKQEETDWEQILLDGFQVSGSGARDLSETETFERVTVQRHHLSDYLYEQLQMLDLTDRQWFLADEFIGNVGDDGYLQASLEEIVEGVNRLLGYEPDGDGTGGAGEEGEAAGGLDVIGADEMPGIEETFETAGVSQAGEPGESGAAEAVVVAERADEPDVADEPVVADEPDVAGEPDVADEPASSSSAGADAYSLVEVEEMLRIIHQLDPPGICARDLRECLLLQLEDNGSRDTLTYKLVDEAFDDLIGHRWSDIAKRYAIDPRDVQDAADALARLDPKPGLRFLSSEGEYVVPDLIVEKIEGEYRVFLNDSGMPRLRISKVYRNLAGDKKRFVGETREFVTEKLNGAQWLIQAIEQRRQTMLKVMNFIVDRQRDFLEKGIEHLKPLTLREVAEVIDMHESTVSRVTNQKYAQTPRGVFPLKFFFSSSLGTTSGEDASARAVRAQIRKLVDEENSTKPLTDAEIVDALRNRGVRIARRTVAKYRDQLGILPARMRKRI
ncbi:MAG: RNA polymerase factor sigma-54 [Gemmatimonadales bacterium]